MLIWGMVAAGGVPCAGALSLEKVLEETEARYAALEAFTADFVQKTTSAAAQTMATEARGKLYYQKPRKMCWKYEAPEKQTFIIDGDHAWLHVPEENQISLFQADVFLASPVAKTFFDGVVELGKHFRVVLDGDDSTARLAALRLTPKKEDPQVKSLRLWIDLQSYRIVGVETRDALGNTNRLEIRDQKEARRLDPRLFRFEAPAGTVVLDSDGREMTPSEVEKVQKALSRK